MSGHEALQAIADTVAGLGWGAGYFIIGYCAGRITEERHRER